MIHQVAYVFTAKSSLIELREKEHLAIDVRSGVWLIYEGGRVHWEDTAARVKMKFLVSVARHTPEAFAHLSKGGPISFDLFDRYWTLDRAYYKGGEEGLDNLITDFDRSVIPLTGNEFVDNWIRLGASGPLPPFVV